jgi:DNA-binding PadR family transcriptional regulator
MAEIPDKRRRTDLDLFILALIDGGLSTPYELQKSAGLSQGATIPALQRLLEARFVRQGRPGARGRTDYKVSAAGKRALRDGWQPLIASGPTGDPDSDLRVALLAMLGSGNRLLAATFLRKSADERVESPATHLTASSDDLPPLARWYTDLRSNTASALLEAESRAIHAMAEALPKSLIGKRGRSAVTRKKLKGV